MLWLTRLKLVIDMMHSVFLCLFLYVAICLFIDWFISCDCDYFIDENYNSSKDEASSPSKRTKSVVEMSSPSVLLHRLPLSPRKDLNLSSPIHQPQDHSSAPNTLPKTSSKPAVQPLARTRRNLTSSFASATSDSSSLLQQRCNSVDEIGEKARVRTVTDVETKITDEGLTPTAVSAVSSSTLSKSHRSVSTPSKTAAESPRLRSPSKAIEMPSKSYRTVGTPSKTAAELSTLRSPSKAGETPSKTYRTVGTPSKTAAELPRLRSPSKGGETPSKTYRTVGTPSKTAAELPRLLTSPPKAAETPSKSYRTVGTPSKSVAESPRLRSPHKTGDTPSKHELTTMRLIKDTGMLINLYLQWTSLDILLLVCCKVAKHRNKMTTFILSCIFCIRYLMLSWMVHISQKLNLSLKSTDFCSVCVSVFVCPIGSVLCYQHFLITGVHNTALAEGYKFGI